MEQGHTREMTGQMCESRAGCDSLKSPCSLQVVGLWAQILADAGILLIVIKSSRALLPVGPVGCREHLLPPLRDSRLLIWRNFQSTSVVVRFFTAVINISEE